MSESERFHRYGGISKGKRSDSEIPAVDDGDPVLRPKPCSKPRWSDPTFLVLGFVAFIVVGYMSMFYTTHELGQSYSQYRKEEAKHVETVEDLHAVSFGERDYDQDVIAGLGSSGPNEPADYGVTTSNKALGISESREVRPQTPDGKKEEVLLTGARESGSIDGVPKESRGGEKPAEKTVHAPEESLKYSGSINQPGLSETVETLEKGDEAIGSTSGLKKPNVFFFLIDDMGYGDIGYQSTDLKGLTPNLDRLAKEGIKLSNYYSMSLCTPARASLMTGRYPIRLGMQYSVLVPGEPWGLPLYEKILPQYMNDAGYESHMVGKWHLGSYNYESLPTHRGFETYLGYLNGEDNYWTHKNVEAYLDNKQFYDFGFGNQTDYYDITRLDEAGMPCSAPKMTGGSVETGHDYAGAFLQAPTSVCYIGGYPTDTFLGRAHQVVKSKTPWDDKPLFMYIAHQSVHSPLGPAPIEGFNKKEQEKLQAVWETTTSSNRADFAGVLAYLDKRIGIFVKMLEEKGWLENSIIVVASDNGGCPSDGGCNYPLRGSKQSMFEGGTKVPAFIYSKSHLPKESWGKSYDELMHVSDWVPTLVSAAGSQPTGSAGALDGIDHWGSIMSVHSKDSNSYYNIRKELLYNWDAYLLSSTNGLKSNYKLAQGAFREGDWKLLMNVWCSGYYSHDPTIIESDPLLNIDNTCIGIEGCEDCADSCQDNGDCLFGDHLFNLRNDSREENDLIHQYPEIAKHLRARVMEVVFKEYTPSGYKDVNTDSYYVWKANDWWMVPWVDKLHPQTT